MKKEYLGDSVYICEDDYRLVLTTENGYGASNTIVLEPEVVERMLLYIELWAQQERSNNNNDRD